MCKAMAILVVLLGMIAFLNSCAELQVLPLKSHPATTDTNDGWRSLFAEDLSNCIYKPGAWAMENGVLSPRVEGNKKKSRGQVQYMDERKIWRLHSGFRVQAGRKGQQRGLPPCSQYPKMGSYRN